jgi:hypothetical protein
MSGTLEVNVIQRDPSVPAITFNNVSPGFIISSTAIRNGTRTAVSLAAIATLFSGTFVKLRSDTTIIAVATVFGEAFNSGNCGVCLKIDGGAPNYGLQYQYDGGWSSTIQTTTISGQCQFTGIAAGTRTMSMGWHTFNGSASDRPFGFLNPNSSTPGENRNQQMVSSIYVYEITV